jgi:EAL domain-containing protein (putative c-di-GMP-specific phosphodiesterase class I)/CheY-like chemotaxis protein
LTHERSPGIPQGVSSTSTATHRLPARPIRVVIAEDDATMRTALGALLARDPALTVLASGADADEAIDLCARHQPDVCLVDVTMPAGGGPRATRVIRERCPSTEVLALSGHEDRETVVEMLRAGACGYLVKGNDPDEVLAAVRGAARGQRPLSPVAADNVVDELADHLAREDEALLGRRETEHRLERVLSNGLLGIALQPIVELDSREAVAFEALARFSAEPVRSPALWFAEAADAGRLSELELAAVRAAFGRLPALPDGTQLSVNVSPSTAASDAFRRLLPSDASSERIIVEITEHAPIDDYEGFAPRIERLRRRGVRLAVDDAGAGFASLRHILQLSPDIIKTDMTLTRRIETDRAERALTRALISFAAEMGATIVAEGIESEAEVRTLRDLGVTYGQGFHLGRPSAAVTAGGPPVAGGGALGGARRVE